MATSGTDAGTPPDVDVPQIVKTEGVLDGDPRIDGTRVGVSHVFERYAEGDEDPEAIASGFEISIAEVHAALAYAFHNQAEMRTIDDRGPDLPGSRVTPNGDS